MKTTSAHSFILPGAMSRWSRSLATLAVCAALFHAQDALAQLARDPDRPAEAPRGFLEIARDPNATPAQKRTIAIMMDFVKETDPAAAFAKLKATDTLALYGGGGEDDLSDLTPISGLTGLETLVLFNHRISDLAPLASLQNLKTLRLEVNRISDLGPLAKLRMLESLRITDNQISDLRPLKDLTVLSELQLSGNKVKELGVVANLGLNTLNLAGNGLADISELRAMNRAGLRMIALNLSNNAIRDVAPLAEIPKLSNLDLSDNHIENADALLGPELTWLNLQGNRLTRSPNLRNTKLGHINLRRNPIMDYVDLVAFKKANPMVEIVADEGFTRAFEQSIPLQKELEGSPLLGTWRTNPIESEWGQLIIELKFRPNGVIYQSMLAAEPDAGNGENNGGMTTDGTFAVKGNQLAISIRNDTSSQKFEVKNDVLTLEQEDEKVTYKKVKE
jgi:hypothetical protein